MRAAIFHPLAKLFKIHQMSRAAALARRPAAGSAYGSSEPAADGGDLEVKGDKGLLAFRLSEKYAALLTALSVCLVTASVIPVLYFIVALHFVVAGVTGRVELFHLASTPPLYDARLARAVETMLPFAIIAHVAFAIVSYAGADFLCIVGYVPLAMIMLPCCCCGMLVRVCGSDDDVATVQDVNMAVPYQQFWAHPPYVHPLRHVYHVAAASESWTHPTLSPVSASGDVVASPAQVSMFGAVSHAVGRVPGACIADRVDAFHTMQRTVELNPHLLEQVGQERTRTKCTMK